MGSCGEKGLSREWSEEAGVSHAHNNIVAGPGSRRESEEEEGDAAGGGLLEGMPLPCDVVILILSRLPLSALLRLRLLCKSWNTLLRSSAFLQALGQHHPSLSSPWLVMARCTAKKKEGLLASKELIAYCPPLHNWFTLPIDAYPHIVAALGSGLRRVTLAPLPADPPALSALAIASYGGLLCCVVCANWDRHYKDSWYAYNASGHAPNDYDYHVLIFNCLTGASQYLPPLPPRMPGQRYCRCTEVWVFMLPDPATPGAYLVLLIHDDRPHKYLRIYSSQTGCWKFGQAMTTDRILYEYCSDMIFRVHSSPERVFLAFKDWGTFEDVQNGDLFFHHPKSCSLSAYHTRSDMWNRVFINAELIGSINHHIFKWQGRVFVADAFAQEHFLVSGFKICELRPTLKPSVAAWVEVARSPPKYWQGRYDHITFVHSENIVCMTGFDPCESGNCFEGTYRLPLVYDLACGHWYHLPSYNGATDFLGLFAIQPNLCATP